MKKHNFTLVEILGVMALIIILLVISIGVYSYCMDSSKEKATKATIVRVHNGLQLLQDKGYLAKTDGFVKISVDNNSQELKINGNVVGGNTESKDNYKKKVFKLFAKSIDADSIAAIQDANGNLCDGWGQPIYVCFPGKFNKGGIDIISAGGDGGFGESAADAPETAIGKYKDSDNDLICDDVSNFF